MKITSICFRQSSSAEIVETSFEITHMSAKEKKHYNIDETLIKLCLLKAASLVLRKTCSKKWQRLQSWILGLNHPLMSSQKALSVKFSKVLHNNTLEKIACVCIDGGLTMFESRFQSEFIAEGENLKCGWISLRDSSRGPELQDCMSHFITNNFNYNDVVYSR